MLRKCTECNAILATPVLIAGGHYCARCAGALRAIPRADGPDPDPVNHPAHYTGHPSGVECIRITEHMNFCLGNALKYIWRAGLKGDAIEDLEKARWYLDREIARRRKGGAA